ncbi:heavy-metal-associated domain-containing protein [uncultured Bacteroides sp.]|uniref:heavy-metal-associated domain-containing protein n=1 Tax=uncultured Bacteroides sp. TaxID=162156 RepID=UPI0026114C57|nr:heavy metal-associated domain-containing protein [uncultured Bacteroides sp.]
MKSKIFALLAVLLMGVVSPALAKDKKDKETVTFLVSMTCEKCQQRIENNIAYEKGVTGLTIDLPKKLVTIEYRTEKTNSEKLKKAIQDLGYTATPFRQKNDKETEKNDSVEVKE